MNQPWKVIAAFAGIFLAGAVTGGSASYYWIRNSRPVPPQGPRIPIEQFVRNQLAAMTKKLALTEEQLSRITPILNQTSLELRRMHEDTTRDADKILERQDSDIIKILNPEQQSKFEQWRREQKEKFDQGRKERLDRMRKPSGPGNPRIRRAGDENPPPPPAPNEQLPAGPEPRKP